MGLKLGLKLGLALLLQHPYTNAKHQVFLIGNWVPGSARSPFALLGLWEYFPVNQLGLDYLKSPVGLIWSNHLQSYRPSRQIGKL